MKSIAICKSAKTYLKLFTILQASLGLVGITQGISLAENLEKTAQDQEYSPSSSLSLSVSDILETTGYLIAVRPREETEYLGKQTLFVRPEKNKNLVLKHFREVETLKPQEVQSQDQMNSAVVTSLAQSVISPYFALKKQVTPPDAPGVEIVPEVFPLAQTPAQPDPDPELGTLLLQEIERPTPRGSQPKFFVLGGVDYINNSNIFSLVDPVQDGLFNARLTLMAVPYSTPQTAVFASAGGNLIRYSQRSEIDYNQLTFNVGVRQQLWPRTYGELGWLNQQLYSNSGGDRFLNDHALYLELGRQDPLARNLTLDSSYQLRWSNANPSNRSQVVNALRLSLGYAFAPQWKTSLDYQFVLSTFTAQDRQDTYHQLLARLTYSIAKNGRVEIFTGPSFGGSSDPLIDINGYVFGIRLGFNLP
ncbi:hypothetical protein K4A83_10575 [Spirulina subsalsa FACHB-351]|uniref:Uncharacterized protein n=1 Tax=Spirulina subsalsa FACHB-351 TaxID=234711 RepID=A0ABT3L689_9CYAN|nr:hypothetical protein [Spirulina subsalsa]MCW6036702.1 hypothetical protein [Spirulina subsalsa FACHB-351]